MSASQRRKEIWTTMESAKIQVGQVVPPEIGYKKPPAQTKGFAESTAASTGKSKREINRATRRAREVCQAEREAGNDVPVVAWRSNGKPWRCLLVLDVDGLADVVREGLDGNNGD